ncbi:MAG: twin-arginine translocase TatA/TatE family subunit [Bacteroidetes bacterium]|nr:twin-arginine translocase TatA/TatE family subunit [Bacteroidota bacterium]
MNNHVLLLFNIGGCELFFIVLVVIMFFGSKKIPELARGIGKGIREIKNATNDIQQEIKDSTKDITNITNGVNVEKQVRNFIDKSIIIEETKPKADSSEQPSDSKTVSRSNTES